MFPEGVLKAPLRGPEPLAVPTTIAAATTTEAATRRSAVIMVSSWSWSPEDRRRRLTTGKPAAKGAEKRLSGVLARLGQVLLDQRVRELPLGVSEFHTV